MNKLLDKYGTDLTLEKEGVWVQIDEDLKVKVCALGNDEFKRVLTKLQAPYKNQFRSGNIDPNIEETIYTKAVAKAVLVDWEGMLDPDTGEDLPYTYENALKILSDRRIKRLKGIILALSTEQETFKKQEQEESEKNLGTTSDGKSSGKSKIKQ